jgi:hypothetical protein
MTRVEDATDAQRATEERRIAETDAAKQKKAAEEFKRTLSRQQLTQQQMGQRPQNEQPQRQVPGSHLLARSGIQRRGFAEQLRERGDGAVRTTGDEVKTRRRDNNEQQVKVDEKQQRSDEAKREKQHDRLAPISRDDSAQQDSGGGELGGGDGHSGSGKDLSGGGEAAAGSVEIHGAPAPGEAQGATGARLPRELIHSMVAQAFAGVTPEGFHQFTVELKDGVLGGARLDVVADGGNIRCTFHTSDKNVARLVRASEGALAGALEKRHLRLESLDVP